MTSWTSLLVALVLLCSSTLCSLVCDLTQGLQEDFSLLNQVSTFSLVPCLKDRTNFNFPKEAMEGSHIQGEDAKVIVHEMLQQIFNLFSQNAAPATWNHIQLMQLLIGLNQQLEELERCLGQNVEWEEPSLESESLRLALKSYFRGISQYLQGKKYSRCAWEILRVEIRRVFLFMSKLTRKLRE
ncbi:interferon alpha-16-like [Trichosurus vulpecula]|uniref:interferon alpha-16-like n=1 Tax=Trichosurus vulpecula TaxID=9337 RepID=UPI00186B16CA|nr:interferon alpha-16-like [Trichosurus vulpecula]